MRNNYVSIPDEARRIARELGATSEEEDAAVADAERLLQERGIVIDPLPLQAAPRYRKVALVHAVVLEAETRIATPEGVMVGHPGDYLVSDDPPTHLWPVRREVFERTYEPEP